MKVAELRALIDGQADDKEVVVRICGDHNSSGDDLMDYAVEGGTVQENTQSTAEVVALFVTQE